MLKKLAPPAGQEAAPPIKRASLAMRVAMLTTGLVALTLALISAIVYLTAQSELRTSLDESMIQRANDAVAAGFVPGNSLSPEVARALDVAGIKVLVVRGGRIFTTANDSDGQGTPLSIPISQPELAVSLNQAPQSIRTATIDGSSYRIAAVQATEGTALLLAQPMDSIEHALERLRLLLLFTFFVGVLVAGFAGWVVATNGLSPVRRLTAATERVARTQDLKPIEVTGSDELARLTISFNHMLGELDASQERQRQLVADAGHELRTPLTSLRTNIELLGQATLHPERTLTVDDRLEIMSDVRSQLGELTTLVGDLVELAREDTKHVDPEAFDLSDVVASAVKRVQPRAPGATFDVDTDRWMMIGDPALMERAVTNLLDNAAKWGPPEGTVTVRLADGKVTVRDEGPGIAAADLPHVFDRFYRSTEARTLPGSGLGLSIVRRTAERHGGSVSVESTPGHGATFTMNLPGRADD